MRFRFGVTGLCVVLLFSFSCHQTVRDPLPGIPRLVLWAWERPDNLSFIVPRTTAVAFLAGTIELTMSGFAFHPRMQPLQIPKQTRLIAVIRIEAAPGVGQAEVEPCAKRIVWAARLPGVRALQIDYDVRASGRLFYRKLLAVVRRMVPHDVPVEITALVSWCMSDRWMQGLPIAEAVPMFFRMGIDPHERSEQLREPLCESAIGVSMDEDFRRLPSDERIYVFDPRGWNESDYRDLLRQIGK